MIKPEFYANPGTLANSEDPDETSHDAAFHQGLHCLQRQNLSSEKDVHFYLFFFFFLGGGGGFITCYPSIYTMDYSDLTVSIFMEN